MKIGLSAVEGRVLHGLIEEASGDIVIRIDRRGFIIHASGNIAELGLDFGAALLLPHITDLAQPDHAASLGEHIGAVLAGETRPGWIEFPIAPFNTLDAAETPMAPGRRWYAISLRPMHDAADPAGAPDGGCA